MTEDPKLVDNANFHVWTDALHARELARRARDSWNRGTYVRWCVNSAWTAFEMACEDALDVDGLRPDFWRGLDDAVAAKSLPPLERGKGVWSNIASVHKRRRQYTHPGADQELLFPLAHHAEETIRALREGIKSIYTHARKSAPKWVEADVDMGYTNESFGHTTLVRAGVTRDTPNMIRVAYLYQGREYDTEWMPPGSDWKPVVERLIADVRAPISKVLVYEGSNIIFSRDLPMRGSF